MLPGYEETQTKRCNYCELQIAICNFGDHSHHGDGKDNRCNDCFRDVNAIAAMLHKIAPEKPAVCPVCLLVPKRWSIDHSHDPVETFGEYTIIYKGKFYKFRGWLCDPCNRSIGQLGDNQENLQRAVDYLRKFNDSLRV